MMIERVKEKKSKAEKNRDSEEEEVEEEKGNLGSYVISSFESRQV